MDIEYVRYDAETLKQIEEVHDSHWLSGHVAFDDNAFPLAAMDGDLPVGFIYVSPQTLDYPLEQVKEAYINIIEVLPDYQRRGIGQGLVLRAEDWAREQGFRQIRTHSNDKAVSAIHMWHKLNYGLCPHVFYAEEGCRGYWVAKALARDE